MNQPEPGNEHLTGRLRRAYLAERENLASREAIAPIGSSVRPTRLRTPGYAVGPILAGVGVLLTIGTALVLTRAYPPGVPASAPSSTVDAYAIPESYDGRPVVVGPAAEAAIAGLTGDNRALVGGWLFTPGVRSCPQLPPAWNACFAHTLYPDPAGGHALALFTGGGPVSVETVPIGSVIPVIFEVHVNDPRCPEEGVFGCLRMPVVDQRVWQGSTLPTMSATSTVPPVVISQETAEATALSEVQAISRATPVVQMTVLGRVADLGLPISFGANKWVWSITIGGQFEIEPCPSISANCVVADTARVILDSETGALVLLEVNSEVGDG